MKRAEAVSGDDYRRSPRVMLMGGGIDRGDGLVGGEGEKEKGKVKVEEKTMQAVRWG
jgi:hypothetical protein